MKNRFKVYLSFFIILLGFIIYFPLLDNFFLSDDFNILHRLKYGDFFEKDSFFRPLSDLSLLLDLKIWDLNPVGFYLSNILIHSFSSVLVFLFIDELLKKYQEEKSSSLLPIIGSLIFLIYPFHLESVVWIAGRGALLATFFSLASFYVSIKFDTLVSRMISVSLFFIGLFAYESIWIFPIIISFYYILYLNKSKNLSISHVVKYSLGYWIAFIGYLLIRFYFIGQFIGSYGSSRHLVINENTLANVFKLIGRTLIPPFQNTTVFILILSIFIIIILVLCFLYNKKASSKFLKIQFVIICFYLISLLPVISLGIDMHDFEGGRFLYFPSIFYVLLIISFLYIIYNRKALFCLILSCLTYFFIYNREVLHQYEMASRISNNTFNSFSKINEEDSFCVDRLPLQYRGAYIFRNGFNSSLQLSKKNNFAGEIVINSVNLIDHYKNKNSKVKEPIYCDNSKNKIFEFSDDGQIITYLN